MTEEKKSAKKPAAEKAPVKPQLVKMITPENVPIEVHPDEVENYQRGGCKLAK